MQMQLPVNAKWQFHDCFVIYRDCFIRKYYFQAILIWIGRKNTFEQILRWMNFLTFQLVAGKSDESFFLLVKMIYSIKRCLVSHILKQFDEHSFSINAKLFSRDTWILISYLSFFITLLLRPRASSVCNKASRRSKTNYEQRSKKKVLSPLLYNFSAQLRFELCTHGYWYHRWTKISEISHA